MSRCEVCGIEIEDHCDVCEKHALTNEQLAELGRRVKAAMSSYYEEIWGVTLK